jgi:prefoldin subunit 5
LSERKSLKKCIEDLAKCVKDLTAVGKIHEKRIQQLEKKMDRLLKEAKDGSRARRGRGGFR